MPDVDGLEATRRIRALEGLRGGVPIVAVTAQSFAEQIRECRRAGMDDHLAKPFTQAALLRVIAGVTSASGRVVWHDDAVATDAKPAVPPAPEAGAEAEPPIFDREAFDSTVSFLEPDAISTFLQTLARQGDDLLSGLRDPASLVSAAKDVSAAAHRFAGSSEMFGFKRVGVAARMFERAVQAGSPELPAAIEHLSACLEEFFAASLRLQPDLQPGMPLAPAPPAPAGPVPPAGVFDRGSFDSTASFLDPEAIASYLQTLREQAEALRDGLDDPAAAATPNLAKDAHRFAGSAEMFGFVEAGAASRVFERAAQAQAPEAPQAASDLVAALDRFLTIVQQLGDEYAATPARAVEAAHGRHDPQPVTAGD